MRSTRATAAVARLNERAGTERYVMTLTGAGRFILTEHNDAGSTALSAPLDLDDFVAFVNAQGPQAVRRMTKSDVAFQEQLKRNRGGA